MAGSLLLRCCIADSFLVWLLCLLRLLVDSIVAGRGFAALSSVVARLKPWQRNRLLLAQRKLVRLPSRLRIGIGMPGAVLFGAFHWIGRDQCMFALARANRDDHALSPSQDQRIVTLESTDPLLFRPGQDGPFIDPRTTRRVLPFEA